MSARKRQNNEETFTAEQVKKLAARIVALRKAQGFTSAENFSNARNINRTQYARYEKGQNLKYASLVRVIQAFGVTTGEFFSEGFD
jgi:transcriptional regulator with XRE-family HTH domain